jgi:magnesium transporter
MLTNFICTPKELKEIKTEELKHYVGKKLNTIWVDISHVTNEETNILKEVFKIHPTTIEDIFSQQTPVKYEVFEDYKVIIFKGINQIKKNSVETYNIAFVIGSNFVITVDKDKSDMVEELLKNNKKTESLLRRGKGYLVHYIMDKEVDEYVKIKSELSEELRKIEKEFLTNQSKDSLAKMYSKEINFLELRHLSESITDLCLNLTKSSEHREDNSLIPYFKDVYDHALKTAKDYQSMLERMNGMEEMHATMTSMKTNEAMRSLTIIMALMMPLTIITGFYGMNVQLPFQTHNSASLIIFLSMIFSAIVMVIISKRRGWISKENK